MNSEEVIAAIDSAEAFARQLFSALDEDQLRTRIHDEEGGWTALEILLHLGANRERMLRFQDIGAKRDDLYGESFEQWNNGWVTDRSNLSVDAALDELFEQNQLARDDLRRLDEAALGRNVPSRNAEMSLLDMFQNVCAGHTQRHAERVATVLGIATADGSGNR